MPAATEHLAFLQIFWQTVLCKSIVSETFSRKECHLMSLEFTSTRKNAFSGFRTTTFYNISKPAFMGHFYNLFP